MLGRELSPTICMELDGVREGGGETPDGAQEGKKIDRISWREYQEHASLGC